MPTLSEVIDLASGAGECGATAVSDFVAEMFEDTDSLHTLVADLDVLIDWAQQVRAKAKETADSEPNDCGECGLPDSEMRYVVEDNAFYCVVCGAANMPTTEKLTPAAK